MSMCPKMLGAMLHRQTDRDGGGGKDGRREV